MAVCHKKNSFSGPYIYRLRIGFPCRLQGLGTLQHPSAGVWTHTEADYEIGTEKWGCCCNSYVKTKHDVGIGLGKEPGRVLRCVLKKPPCCRWAFRSGSAP